MDLTDEEKEKLDGSYKVAKKLEKLQSGRALAAAAAAGGGGGVVGGGVGPGGTGVAGVSGPASLGVDGDSNGVDGETPSLDSFGSSDKTSPETSLTGSNGDLLILFFFHFFRS